MKQVSAALVKAQRSFGPALKDKTNPAFRSKYADLGACVDAVMSALNDNGIFLMQCQHPAENGVCVETIFVHESGEQISAGMLSVPATKHDAQGYGSALTYARRYSLMTACGIAPEDDDGAAASKPRQEPAKPAPAPSNGMSKSNLQDWLQAIQQASAAELKSVANDAFKAAKEVQDEAALETLRSAATKRKEALA